VDGLRLCIHFGNADTVTKGTVMVLGSQQTLTECRVLTIPERSGDGITSTVISELLVMHQLWGGKAVRLQDASAYSSVYGFGAPRADTASGIIAQLEQSHRRMSPAPLRARSRRPSSQASLGRDSVGRDSVGRDSLGRDNRCESTQADPANPVEVLSGADSSTPPRSCEQTRASTPASTAVRNSVAPRSPVLRLREPHVPETFFKEFNRSCPLPSFSPFAIMSCSPSFFRSHCGIMHQIAVIRPFTVASCRCGRCRGHQVLLRVG
jgi:hypothetical protein